MSVKTNAELKKLISDDEIVMRPLRLEQVNNGSIDVSLGSFFYRIKPEYWASFANTDQGELQIIMPNLHDAEDVFTLESAGFDGKIVLQEGERVLAHTHEFIGSRSTTIPEMRAKSSMARWGLTVCACAGWGDVGFYSRWAMEVCNLNPGPIELDVGTLVAQIVFHGIQTPEDGTLYHQKGSYQNESDVDALIANWTPEQILPKRMKKAVNTPMNAADRG